MKHVIYISAELACMYKRHMFYFYHNATKQKKKKKLFTSKASEEANSFTQNP